MSRPAGGLGRGLGALIPLGQRGVTELDVGAIRPNPHQPRQRIAQESLRELADSIREHGIIQPLIVTEIPAGEAVSSPVRYQLIAGERRWEAAQMAGLERVPVVVKEATPQQMLELALVENVQRADLNPLEEATAYRQLMDEFSLTQEQVARKVGKSRVAVANSLRLLGAPDGVRDALMEGQITEGHARALLGLDDPEHIAKALEVVLKKSLSVRETEALVRRWNEAEGPKGRRVTTLSPETQELEDHFRTALGTRVALHRSSKGGRLVVYFYSDEELEGLYRAIVEKGSSGAGREGR